MSMIVKIHDVFRKWKSLHILLFINAFVINFNIKVSITFPIALIDKAIYSINNASHNEHHVVMSCDHCYDWVSGNIIYNSGVKFAIII